MTIQTKIPTHCVVCEDIAHFRTDGGFYHTECHRCGMFHTSQSEHYELRALILRENNKAPLLSNYIRQQNAIKLSPLISKLALHRLFLLLRPLDFLIRKKAALSFYVSNTKILGSSCQLSDPQSKQLQAVLATYDEKEVGFICNALEGEGLMGRAGDSARTVLPKGYEQNDAWQTEIKLSSQGFVAMAFHADMGNAWTNGIRLGISDAGYNPFRVDEQDFIGGITDKILAEIRASKFVVADYTKHRGGVYFETGFAVGIGIPVFSTCHEDDFDKLHFDVQHINTIKWKDASELADRVANRIVAVLGRGPLPASM